MNTNLGNYLSLDNCCPRCGKLSGYHNKAHLGLNTLPCVRKKPFKLRDGTDLKLGMEVWHVDTWDKTQPIIRGMVRFITSWGSIRLYRYPEDVLWKDFSVPNEIIQVPSIAFDHTFSAYRSCFSTKQAALDFQAKIK